VNYKDIPLVIFAGGKSSRMRRDKSLLPFSSSPTLTQFQIKRFSPYFKKIYISTKTKNKFDFDANFIEDFTKEESSPFIGLISVLESLKDEYIFVLSVDTPFFNYDDFLKLSKTLDSDAIVAKTKNSYQPLCAIYKRDILKTLKGLQEKKLYKFSFLYDKIITRFVKFENEKSFDNLNFPKDYEDALKRIENEKGIDLLSNYP
jgi:molybdopterin-guanine dinucleotide biosynthesis protein A